MRVVTIVSLGACALFGLGALVVAKTMLPATAAAKTIVQPVVGVPVVVAKSALKFGDRLEAGKLEVLKLPSNAVPDGAFATVAQALTQDHGGAPVALTPIAAREPLLPAKLSGPGARASVAAEIADGMRAYTIKVSDVTGVGGHALPGDRVDVVLMRDLSTDASKHNYQSNVVIQNIRVLGVDLNADLASNKPATPTTATLEVSVPDAQKLAVAGDMGKLSLALRKTGSSELAVAGSVSAANIVGGGASAPRAFRGAAHRTVVQMAAAPAPPPMISVVAGDGSGKAHTPRVKPTPPTPPTPPAPLAPLPPPAATADAGSQIQASKAS